MKKDENLNNLENKLKELYEQKSKFEKEFEETKTKFNNDFKSIQVGYNHIGC
jgi:chaperonin cofactor prefoldin